MLAAGSALLLSALFAATPAAAAPAWIAARDLSAPGQDAAEPQIAVDATGGAVAVWVRSDGSHAIVQSARRPLGGPWLPVQNLSAPGQDASEPQVAVDPVGNAVAVWARSNGSHTIVQSAGSAAGGPWSGPADLSASGRNASEPAVDVDAAGNAVALWHRFDGADYVAQGATKLAGGTWGGPVDVSAPGEDADEPQVALDGVGNAVAVWTREGGADSVVESAAKPAGAGWGEPSGISAEGGAPGEPRLALDPTGSAVAVWAREDGGDEIVEAAGRPAGGSWQAPLPVSAAGGDSIEPDVALDPTGEAVVVWVRAAGPATAIAQASLKPAGGAWQPSLDLSPGGVSTAEAPRVAVDPAGNAVAVWGRSAGNPTIVEAARRPKGGGWLPSDTLSELGGTATEPGLALDPAGDGAAIWSRDDGANTIVQVAGHDRAGPLVGSLSIPPAATMKRPVAFSIAPFDNWASIGAIGWSFGDGAVASGPTATHAYVRPGVYPVGASAAAAFGNASAVGGAIRVFPKPNASRNVRVRRGRALLRLRCPSPAGCAGALRLVAGFKLKKRGPKRGKRMQIGKAGFAIPGARTTTVPVKLSRRARKLVRGRGRKGVRTQLTGPGVRHRLVILFERRKKRIRRRHARHLRPSR